MFAVVDMTELGVLLGAVFTAFVAIMGAFFKYMDSREKASREERRDDREVFAGILEKLSQSIDSNTQSQMLVASNSDRIATSTDRAAAEAKDRNGHLGEQNIQIIGMVAKMTNQIQAAADRNLAVSQKALDAIKHVKEQHVDRQFVHEEIVDHEIVNHKEG